MSDKIRTITGEVISDKRDKTLTVQVMRVIRHPLFGKVLRRKTKYQVHDPENQGKMGDIVEIMQIRPVSKTKTWGLARVVKDCSETATA